MKVVNCLLTTLMATHGAKCKQTFNDHVGFAGHARVTLFTLSLKNTVPAAPSKQKAHYSIIIHLSRFTDRRHPEQQNSFQCGWEYMLVQQRSMIMWNPMIVIIFAY